MRHRICFFMLTSFLLLSLTTSFAHAEDVEATATVVLPIFKGAYSLFVDNHVYSEGGGDYTYYETGLWGTEYYVYVEGNLSTTQYYQSRLFFFEYAHPPSANITKFQYEIYTDGYNNQSYYQIFIDTYNVTSKSWNTHVYDSGQLPFENTTDYVAKELNVNVPVPAIWRLELLIHSYADPTLEYGYNALNVFRIQLQHTIPVKNAEAQSKPLVTPQNLLFLIVGVMIGGLLWRKIT